MNIPTYTSNTIAQASFISGSVIRAQSQSIAYLAQTATTRALSAVTPMTPFADAMASCAAFVASGAAFPSVTLPSATMTSFCPTCGHVLEQS